MWINCGKLLPIFGFVEKAVTRLCSSLSIPAKKQRAIKTFLFYPLFKQGFAKGLWIGRTVTAFTETLYFATCGLNFRARKGACVFYCPRGGRFV